MLHYSILLLAWPAQAVHLACRAPTSAGGPVLLAGGWSGTLAEAILESSRHRLEVLHAARARAALAVGLLTPVVGPHLAGGVAAARAPLLLVVEGSLAAARADAVALRVLLAHGRCTIPHG